MVDAGREDLVPRVDIGTCTTITSAVRSYINATTLGKSSYMADDDVPNLQYLAEQVVIALRNNASILSGIPTDPSIAVRANDALGRAAGRYASAVADLTGWGNPFAVPPDGDDDDDEPSDSSDQILVEVSHLLTVSSREHLLRFMERRDVLAEPPAPGEVDPDDEIGMVQAPLEIDGWKPEEYINSGLVVVDRNWSIERL